MQVGNDLLQLLRRQPQRRLPQILRNIFGKFVLTDFQPLHQLNHDLISLIRCQKPDDAKQGGSGIMAHDHVLADFYKV